MPKAIISIVLTEFSPETHMNGKLLDFLWAVETFSKALVKSKAFRTGYTSNPMLRVFLPPSEFYF